MGFLDALLGGGLDAKLKALDKAVEHAEYDAAEEMLLDLRARTAPKHPTGSEVATRLDLAEGRLRLKYQQLDRVESPVRRAYIAAKGLTNKDLLRDATEALLGCAARAGRYGEAVELAEQWISMASPDFKLRVDVLTTKGSALLQLNRFEDALKAFEAAIRLVDAMPATPDKHERFVTASSGMGDAYLGMEDRPKAINAWRQAMAATRSQYGDDHPQIAAILVCIGTEQMNADELDAARSSFTQAVEVFRSCGQAESIGTSLALRKLALTHLMIGEYDRAELHAKDAIRAATSHGPEVRARAQELLRKIEDARLTARHGSPAQQAKPAPANTDQPASDDDLPMHDLTMFPGRPLHLRQPVRQGRTIINTNFAPLGQR